MPTYQMNSRQCEQNVGCLKNVAMNLCPLTWWTRLRIAPRRLLKPARSLNSRPPPDTVATGAAPLCALF